MVGLGGAGTRVADHLAQRAAPGSLWERIKRWFFPPDLDLAVLAADAPEAVPTDLTALDPGDVIPLGDGGGVGGDMERGSRYWRRDGPAVRDAAGETDPWDVALVVGAVGGGTAGAALGPATETIQGLDRDATVVAAPILPFDREADRIHRNVAPALRRLREAAPDAILLLSNEELGSPEGALADVYAGANAAMGNRLWRLLEALSGTGVRSTDLGDLETVLAAGNGFAVLGQAEAAPGEDPASVVDEALSPEAGSADADPADEAARVLLLVRGDPEDLALDAILDRAREALPEREVLLGVQAASGEAFEALAFVSLARSRAVEAVLDRHDDLVGVAEDEEVDELDERLEEVDEPAGIEPEPAEDDEDEEAGGDQGADEGDGGGEAAEEVPEWVEDYRAAQEKAMSLDIKANQSHDDLVAAIREALEGD